MIVLSFYHLSQKTRSRSHTHTRSSNLPPPSVINTRRILLTEQLFAESHVLCEYFRRIKGKKGRKRARRRGEERGRERGMAYHIKFPKDVMTQKQKLINQSVPELFSVLFLISLFLLSSLHLSLPPSFSSSSSSNASERKLRQQWRSYTRIPSLLLLQSLCCALLPPTFTFFRHLSVFSEHTSKSHLHLLQHNRQSSRRKTVKQLWQIRVEKAKTSP